MNCELFSELIGMRCEPQPARDASDCIAVVTPFTFYDGEGITLFARTVGEQAHLFDDGSTLFWLHGAGHRALADRRSWKPLRNALSPYGVSLNDDATIETYARADVMASAFARMVAALLAVDAWAREVVGAGASIALEEEAAMYLRAWRPREQVSEHPEALAGMSGLQHTFALLQAGEYIDAIGPSQAASSAELRKLVDVRSHAANAEIGIRVIVDDRRQPDRALLEATILGRFAKAWPMTRLIAAAGAPSMPQ